jgi:hypothetical protein
MEFAESDNPLADILGHYDTPAYVRRGTQLANARAQVFQMCQSARDEHLCLVRAHWRTIRRSVSDCRELRNELATEHDYELVCNLEVALSTHGSYAASTTSIAESAYESVARQRRPFRLFGQRANLRALVKSIEWFNRRWSRFLAAFDLRGVNRLVTDYNRYYLLEKECAMRSARLAARGYVPARQITHDELIERYPFLAVPRLRW